MDLSGTSSSFALEALMFRLSPKYVYAGDSNPHLDFLPEFSCHPDTIAVKAGLKMPTIFKCSWTMGKLEEFPVPVISEAIDMKPLPYQFIVESTATLHYLSMMGRLIGDMNQDRFEGEE
jgi:hypothetical protein